MIYIALLHYFPFFAINNSLFTQVQRLWVNDSRLRKEATDVDVSTERSNGVDMQSDAFRTALLQHTTSVSDGIREPSADTVTHQSRRRHLRDVVVVVAKCCTDENVQWDGEQVANSHHAFNRNTVGTVVIGRSWTELLRESTADAIV